MKVLTTSQFTAHARSRVYRRDWDVIDSRLISALRPHGVGLCPILDIRPSSSKNSSALAVRDGYAIPKDYPLAVIPFGCALGSHSWLDLDRTYLVPSIDDLKGCLQRHGHEELLDVVGCALFIAFHSILEHCPLRSQWFMAMMRQANANRGVVSDDDRLLLSTICDVHRALSELMMVPRLDVFASSVQYVLGALVDLDSPDNSDTTVTVRNSVLVPVVDAVCNKFHLRSNVALRMMQRDDVLAIRRSGFSLFGCGQGLASAPKHSQFWAIVTTEELGGGQELSLDQSFPSGDPKLWSPLERLRLGASVR